MKAPAPLLLACSVFLPLPLLADWPHFRGPHGDNSIPAAEIARSFPASGPAVAWSVDVSEGYGGSAIVDGKVFAMDRVDQEKDVLLCLDLDDGKELWRWENQVPGRINHPGSRSVPTVTADAVYCSSGFGHVYCIDRKTHEARWIVDVAKDFKVQPPRFGYSIHPVLAGGFCIVAPTSDEVGLAALDPESGKVAWKSKPVGDSHSSPILVELLGREMLVMPGSKGGDLMLTGFDPKDGTQLFQYTEKLSRGRHNAIPNVCVVGKDRVFFTGGYGQGTQVLDFADKDGAIEVTKSHNLATGATIHPVLKVGDQAYLSAGNDRRGRRRNRDRESSGEPAADAPPSGLICMKLGGEVLWSTGGEPGLGGGSIVNLGGTIVSQDGDDGTLRLLEPGPAYKELAAGKVFSKETGRELWAPLAFADGRLVMRSQHQLACVDLRPASPESD